MTQLKLSCLGHPTRRRSSLKKTVMLGKTEGSSKRARLNMREIDSLKEATGLSLQELSRAVETGRCGQHAFMGSPGVGADSPAHNAPGSQFRGSGVGNQHLQLR